MDEHNGVSRRGFLKLAAGSALGAAILSVPALSLASELTGGATTVKRKLVPVTLKGLPRDAMAAAKASTLVYDSFSSIISISQKISDASLRSAVLKLLNDPTPTFMANYPGQSSISRLYSQLASAGLIDTSKIDVALLLPPYNGSVQPFRTAPGSGYGSHHSYPGGLATHVGVNMHITSYICDTYKEVFGYDVHRDVALAGQAMHDICKPFVFQWQPDGASLKEYTIAGQGAHHVISLAETIYRGFPPEVVVAQACAHGAPSSPKEEEAVVGWLRAAAMMAQKDPVDYGLINGMGGLPAPHHQEGYIVHLGDHDWVLSVPAAQKSVVLLKTIAREKYGMSESDLNGALFNHFRNYVGAQLSFMFLNFLEAEPSGMEQAYSQVRRVITQ